MREITPQYVRMSPSSICIYNEPPINYKKYSDYPQQKRKPIENHFKGEMSDHTRKKVRRIVNNWIAAVTKATGQTRNSKRNLTKLVTFVTLTLSAEQIHTDQEIKREMLNPFLIKLQRKFNVNNYLWVAEKQGNGNIHFHILIDCFVPWQQIRHRWNECQERLNYISRFKAQHNHRNPNSTDIHGLRKIRNPTSYICKYLTKKEDKPKVSGRLWSATKRLNEAKYFRKMIDEGVREALSQLKQSNKVRIVITEYCTFFYGDIFQQLEEFTSSLNGEIELHYQNVFQQLYPT